MQLINLFVILRSIKPIKIMKKIFDLLNKTELPISIDWGSNSIYIKKKIGGYFIGFVAHYNINHYNYVSASYENPEEYSSRVAITDVSDLEIYKGDDVLEFTDEQLQQCINLIKSKIYYA